MPRDVSVDFDAAVSAGTLQPCLLVEGLFDSGALRLWTGYGNLVWNGDTYTGAGTLIGIDPVTETSGIEANGTKISLTGIDSSAVALALAEPYQGRVVNVYLGLFSAGAVTLTGTPIGLLLGLTRETAASVAAGSLIADPDLLFSGRADVMTISDDGATGTIALAVENRLIDLQRGRPRRYTDQDQKLDYPTDRGLEFVVAIQDKVVKWGGSS